MTRTANRTVSMMTVALVSALLVLVATDALANPRFGSRQFQLHLQQDAGLARGAQSYERPCPTIRGVPVPPSWGRQWQPGDEWLGFVARAGHPRGHDWISDRTPARKWNTIVRRYEWYMKTHRCSQREHQEVLEYLEQDYYNYWHRQRYLEDPPDPRSHSHGFRAEGREIWRAGEW